MWIRELRLANFRCFRAKQRVRLAPVTLLVGENSTGKTSFLALTRVLLDLGFEQRFPDFTQPPYDLGSFDEIAHHRGGRGGRASKFEAGFSLEVQPAKPSGHRKRHAVSDFDVTFGRAGAAPVPRVRRAASQDRWVEVSVSEDGEGVSLRFATPNGQWAVGGSHRGLWTGLSAPGGIQQRRLPPLALLANTLLARLHMEDETRQFVGQGGTTQQPTKEDIEELQQLDISFTAHLSSIFSSAPVRSRPRRTYDPTHALQDAEGEYIPMFLSSVARGDLATWQAMRSSLEDFGKAAGLFDEIAVKTLGGRAGGPFQIQVRKLGRRAKGPRRNLIDVGYGVSQVLPVITELLRPYGPEMFLLQQPEVHLHPSAQAALGGLFCDVAARHRQLLVETHSDHLIDRIRMDVRDRRTNLKPEDVSILYFERRNLSVTIHSLGWDKQGRLVGLSGPIPDGYREFFRTERRRSLGL